MGDLRTADHKVLNAECESRNNHRYAVVVQDLVSLRRWKNQTRLKSTLGDSLQKDVLMPKKR